MTADTGTRGVCPRCRHPLVSEPRTLAWCPDCEWKLAAYDPLRMASDWGWRPLDRLLHRLAYRLDARSFRRLAGRPPGRSGNLAGRVLLLAVSVPFRSEERRVGKEGRTGWRTDYKKKKDYATRARHSR